MTAKPHPTRRHRHDAEATPAAAPPIVERPDGYYWIGDGALGEFGPFESYELARADRDAGSEEALAPSDSLADAERETGLPVSADPDLERQGHDGAEPHLRDE